jgi:hypothetical protein
MEVIEVTANSRFGVFLIAAGVAGAAIADKIRRRLLRRMVHARIARATAPLSSRD